MTSTNDEKYVKSNQTSGQKGKKYYISRYQTIEAQLSAQLSTEERTRYVCEAWRLVHRLCLHSTPPTRLHLLAWLQRHTAHAILQEEWGLPDNKKHHLTLEKAINDFTLECHAVAASPVWEAPLLHRALWFKSVLSNPWEHSVLKALLDPNGKQPTDEEVVEWLCEERAVVLVTRLRVMARAKRLTDLALVLASAIMDRVRRSVPANKPDQAGVSTERTNKRPHIVEILGREADFDKDVWELLTDMEFVLLHKLDHSKCIALAKKIPLKGGQKLIERLKNRLENSPTDKKLWKKAKEVAILIAQVVITRCMVVARVGVVRVALESCSAALVQLVGVARLPAAAAALTAPAATATHLYVFADAIHKEIYTMCNDERKPFVCELYVRAITAGMNELERLKLEKEKEAIARAQKQTLSEWFSRLGEVLAGSMRLRCECLLTAFSVHPSADMYERICALPPLAPPTASKQDSLELTGENNSEYGSWATDSCTRTNFVKTSETINLKQTQKQANILSSSIFDTECEALGLSTELCSDLAVLLSGPRVKTLSWDMDREVLLENCHMYMEKTQQGTRALTMELKYLNLDPRSFDHLPEEVDDENDNYGIEKGYEASVDLEDLWPDNATDFPERWDSICSVSSVDSTIAYPREKNRTSYITNSNIEKDPLISEEESINNDKGKSKKCYQDETKQIHIEGNKVQEKKSQHDFMDIKYKSESDKEKELRKKQKKKERRERKKKEKMAILQQEDPLSQLISNVSNAPDDKTVKGQEIERRKKEHLMKTQNITVTDSDYDSQGKSSFASVNSEGNDPDVLFDGLFSMDEIKSPGKSAPNIVYNTSKMKKNDVNVSNIVNITQSPDTKNLQLRPVPFSAKDKLQSHGAKISDIIKDNKEIDNLIYLEKSSERQEYIKRNLKKKIEHRQQIKLQQRNIQEAFNYQTLDMGTSKIVDFNKELERLKMTSEEMKNITKRNEVPNSYDSKRQSVILKKHVNHCEKPTIPKNYSKHVASVPNVKQREDSPSQRQYHEFLNKQALKMGSLNTTPILVDPNQSQYKEFLQQISNQQFSTNKQLVTKKSQQLMNQNSTLLSNLSKPKKKVDQQEEHVNIPIINYTDFAKNPSKTPCSNTLSHEIKIEDHTGSISTTNKQSKHQIRKDENVPNTFSRLSYMHKNKQGDMRFKQTNKQAQTQLVTNKITDSFKSISEAAYQKITNLQTKGEIIISKPNNKITNSQIIVKKGEILTCHPTATNIQHKDPARINAVIISKPSDVSVNISKPATAVNVTKPISATDKLKIHHHSKTTIPLNLRNIQPHTNLDTDTSWKGQYANTSIAKKIANAPINVRDLYKQDKIVMLGVTNMEQVQQITPIHKMQQPLHKNNHIIISDARLHGSKDNINISKQIPISEKRNKDSWMVNTNEQFTTYIEKPNVKNMCKSKPMTVTNEIQKKLEMKTNSEKVQNYPSGLTGEQVKLYINKPLKTTHPIVASILTSDYDQLDDLIDDDLRQEIEESSPLTSEEVTYRSVANTTPVIPKNPQYNIKDELSTKDIIRNKRTNSRQTSNSVQSSVPYSKNPITPVINEFPNRRASAPNVHFISEKLITHYPNTTFIRDDTFNTGSNINSVGVKHTSVINGGPVVEKTQMRVCNIGDKVNNVNFISTPVNIVHPANIIIQNVSRVNRVQNIMVANATNNVSNYGCTSTVINPQPLISNVNYVVTSPSLSLYNSTQFAVPAVNPIIIGNATTVVGSKRSPICSEPQKQSDNLHQYDVTSKNKIESTLEKKVESTEVFCENNIINELPKSHSQPTVCNEIQNSTSKLDTKQDESLVVKKLKDNDTLDLCQSPKKSNVSLNVYLPQNKDSDNSSHTIENIVAKFCERKVLSQVQEKQLCLVKEIIENKKTFIIKQNTDHVDKNEVEKDVERLQKKRFSILHREINHYINSEPIPLSYAPIQQQNNSCHRQHDIVTEAKNVAISVSDNSNDNIKLENKSHKDLGNESTKENNKNILSRRLRSSTTSQIIKYNSISHTKTVRSQSELSLNPKPSKMDTKKTLSKRNSENNFLNDSSQAKVRKNCDHKDLQQKIKVDGHTKSENVGNQICDEKELNNVIDIQQNTSISSNINNLLENKNIDKEMEIQQNLKIVSENGTSQPVLITELKPNDSNSKNRKLIVRKNSSVNNQNYAYNDKEEKVIDLLDDTDELNTVKNDYSNENPETSPTEVSKTIGQSKILNKGSTDDSLHDSNHQPTISNVEEISALSDGSKKVLRIKLSNGNVFRATVSGHLKVDLNTILLQPAIKSLLLRNMSDMKSCTVNVKQVQYQRNKSNRPVTFTTFVTDSSLSTEVIDLISDDENDNIYNCKTEFGDFKVKCNDSAIYAKHQGKLKQKCFVKIVNCKILKNIVQIYKSTKVKEEDISELKNCGDDFVQVQANSEVIANDTTQLINSTSDIENISNNLCTIENNTNIISQPNLEIAEDVKENQQEIGKDDNNTSQIYESENKTLLEIQKCTLQLTKNNESAKTFSQLKKICTVNLERCDKARNLKGFNCTDTIDINGTLNNSKNKMDQLENCNDSLVRRNSLSLLTDFTSHEDLGPVSPSLIEHFETQLIKSEYNNNGTHKVCLQSYQTSCNSDWFCTKPMLHKLNFIRQGYSVLVNDLNANRDIKYEDISTDCDSDLEDDSFNEKKTEYQHIDLPKQGIRVSSLLNIVLKFCNDHYLEQFKHIEIKSKNDTIRSPLNSLKRKLNMSFHKADTCKILKSNNKLSDYNKHINDVSNKNCSERITNNNHICDKNVESNICGTVMNAINQEVAHYSDVSPQAAIDSIRCYSELENVIENENDILRPNSSLLMANNETCHTTFNDKIRNSLNDPIDAKAKLKLDENNSNDLKHLGHNEHESATNCTQIPATSESICHKNFVKKISNVEQTTVRNTDCDLETHVTNDSKDNVEETLNNATNTLLKNHDALCPTNSGNSINNMQATIAKGLLLDKESKDIHTNGTLTENASDCHSNKIVSHFNLSEKTSNSPVDTIVFNLEPLVKMANINTNVENNMLLKKNSTTIEHIPVSAPDISNDSNLDFSSESYSNIRSNCALVNSLNEVEAQGGIKKEIDLCNDLKETCDNTGNIKEYNTIHKNIISELNNDNPLNEIGKVFLISDNTINCDNKTGEKILKFKSDIKNNVSLVELNPKIFLKTDDGTNVTEHSLDKSDKDLVIVATTESNIPENKITVEICAKNQSAKKVNEFDPVSEKSYLNSFKKQRKETNNDCNKIIDDDDNKLVSLKNEGYDIETYVTDAKTPLNKSITMIYKGDSDVILNGSLYEDPVVGTCYVFPLSNKNYIQGGYCNNICDDKIINMIKSFRKKAISERNEDSSFMLKIPKITYSRFQTSEEFNGTSSKLKRKIDSNCECKLVKKYRKGKNIDYRKQTIKSAYIVEYNRLLKYCDTIKFSYSRPFHKENINMSLLLEKWPIQGNIDSALTVKEPSEDEKLFFNDIEDKNELPDPLRKTLAQEITFEYSDQGEYFQPDNESDIYNFRMGFGEGSDRVIQDLENGKDTSIFSAATLSDVKLSQPSFTTAHNKNKVSQSVSKLNSDQSAMLKRCFSFMELRDKVRSFFRKTAFELESDLKMKDKYDPKMLSLKPNVDGFPYELTSPEFFEPPPQETIVNVVQVGELPVSAAAQNPVTCDPRVTQVSNASPPQCSAENSPHDEPQSVPKTEYTELTTAVLSLPLVHAYEQSNQAMMSSQSQLNAAIDANMTEVKCEPKVEIKDEVEENNEYIQSTDIQTFSDENINNVPYTYKSENNHTILDSESHNAIFDSLLKQENDEYTSPPKNENGTPEKIDQIAHAMNAAGITSSDVMNNTTAHALVNILSQKIRQNPVNTTQTSVNYSKGTPISAMALQQALAQILPPPLNQTNSSENQNAPMTPQVLHIVQGKNNSGNQITIVDNQQNSVITNPNNTPVLHIVQNNSSVTSTSNTNTATQHTNSFSGLSLVDSGLQQGGNQLLHIVNTGNQKNNTSGQLLKRVNLLTNLQGTNEQKMVQFVCKSADGKSIQLNAPHQRSMVLRLQPIETPNVQNTIKSECQELSPSQNFSTSNSNKESNNTQQQEIKSRSVYEENYAKFIQNSSTKPMPEKSTSLPKFNQAFGKQVYQDNNQKTNEVTSNSNSHLSTGNNSSENVECPSNDSSMNLEHIRQISSPPLLLRKSPAQTTQSQQVQSNNLVQQIKQTIAPMNIQTMHGGVIYTRQIPVNIGGGQTINLITVPSTDLMDENGQKQQGDVKFVNQNEMESSIIKIVPQNQSNSSPESTSEDNNVLGVSNETPHSNHTTHSQPVLTQMRIKLPMLSKAPHMVSGARMVRPSFFQIQRNVIGGANQPVYQQLVLTAAPPLGQQQIRLPQTQTSRQVKVENQSPESQMSTSTLEQLREFDMVLEQVKERSTVQPNTNNASNTFTTLQTSTSDTTDGNTPRSVITTESTQPVLYSIGNSHSLNVAYVNRKATVPTPTTSTFVRSPDSSGVADSPTSSTHVQMPLNAGNETSNDTSPQPSQSKPKSSSKSKSRPKTSSNPPNSVKVNTVPPKTSTQKPLEDEQTTQRILYILAEYKEQVENSPDKDKPAPRRRSNPPSNPGSSKRKKSSSGSRRSGGRDMSPINGEDSCRTMGSEDSSCGTSQGDCTENCMDSHSPQDSPRKVVRKLTFENETTNTMPRQQPPRNVIVADGQTITVARGTAGKPATAVLMPANYILPVSMVKGGQQIAIVTNRGPKILTVGGEGGATNALLLQRLIGPAGLKPVLTRPGVRHVRLPTTALHNLQAFNLATSSTVQPPDSTASPAPAPTPPDLVETRATSSPWPDRELQDVKPERSSSPEGSEPWNLPSTANPHDYTYEETVRAENMDRTVLGAIPDRYSPDMEAQRIFDKMFDVDAKKSYNIDSQDDSPQCDYDIDGSDCDDKAYQQVVQRRDQRQHRLANVSAAALHKYAILEHELRLQKSLSEECEDLGVDSPSAAELFPEAELLFTASPAPENSQHGHTPQPSISQSIPQDVDDQIATDQLLTRTQGLDPAVLGLDEGIVTVSEDGMQATVALDQEEFARSHPNTTFHSEPTEEENVQPYTISGLKGRHITSTIFHAGRAPATVLMTAPQTTVISQAVSEQHHVKYIENIIGPGHNNICLSSVLVKDDGLTKYDTILNDSRELHLSNTASAIVHSNATQVIRRVCYDDDKRDSRFLLDETDALIAGDDAKMIAEDSSRDATLESIADDRSSPERHAELFWESNSASERSDSRRPLDFSSDSDKCCKSPLYDETNSTDSSGVGTHMRLDSVIKDARGLDRSGSADNSSADDTLPPLRTYPPKRMYHMDGEERSVSGKTRAGERSPDGHEVRRRASGRGVVKRGCHCCNGSPAPPRPKKSRQKKPSVDFSN